MSDHYDYEDDYEDYYDDHDDDRGAAPARTDAGLDREAIARDEASAAGDLRRAAEDLGGLADRLLGAAAERTVHAPVSEVAVGRAAEGADACGHGGRYALRAAGRDYDADAYDALYAAALEARQAVEWHLLAQQYAHDMALLAEYEGNAELMAAEAEARAGMARPSEADWEGISRRMDAALGEGGGSWTDE